MRRPLRIGVIGDGLPGGGQRLAVQVARALVPLGRVDFLAWPPVSRATLRRFHGAPLPFRSVRLGRSSLQAWMRHAALWTAGLDLTVSSLEFPVRSFARGSILLCTFPTFTRREFRTIRPGVVAAISRYTRDCIRSKWEVRHVPLLSPGVPPQPAGRKRPYVLAVARFNTPMFMRASYKGHPLAVRTWHSLCARRPDLARDWELVLAGARGPDARLLGPLRRMARRGPGRVRILLDLSQAAMRRLYAHAPILWHPAGMLHRGARWKEHFGMVVLEGMSAGAVPVVADYGGPREIVRQGRDGYRVRTPGALAERTRKLIDDAPLRRRLSARARARARAYGVSRFERGLRALARRTLRRPHTEHDTARTADGAALRIADLVPSASPSTGTITRAATQRIRLTAARPLRTGSVTPRSTRVRAGPLRDAHHSPAVPPRGIRTTSPHPGTPPARRQVGRPAERSP